MSSPQDLQQSFPYLFGGDFSLLKIVLSHFFCELVHCFYFTVLVKQILLIVFLLVEVKQRHYLLKQGARHIGWGLDLIEEQQSPAKVSSSLH